MGILDPTKVTRAALQHAASISGLMITTEAMVTEIPQSESAAAAPDMGSLLQDGCQLAYHDHRLQPIKNRLYKVPH
jgi:hypothetical protein